MLFDGPVLRAEWQPISNNNTQLYHQRKLASERYGHCKNRCLSSCDCNSWSFCSYNGPNAQAVYIVGGKNSLKRRRSWRASLHSNSMWRNCSQNIPSILFSFFLSPVAGYYRRGYIFAFPPPELRVTAASLTVQTRWAEIAFTRITKGRKKELDRFLSFWPVNVPSLSESLWWTAGDCAFTGSDAFRQKWHHAIIYSDVAKNLPIQIQYNGLILMARNRK